MHTLKRAEAVSPPERKTSDGQTSAFRLQGIVKGGSLLLAASVFGNGMNYLFTLFLARQLEMEEFGLYALGITIFNTLVLLVTTGVDSGAVKFVSDRLAIDDHAGARRVAIGAWLTATVAGCVLAVGLTLAATPVAESLYDKPGLAPVLSLLAAAIPCAIGTTVLLSVLQAYQTVRYTVLVKYLWEPLSKWGAAGLALAAGWGLVGVVGGVAATLIVSAVLAAVLLVRSARVTRHDVATVSGKKDVRALALFCLPLLGANVFGIVAPRMDVMLLGYWATSVDVGQYLVAFQTAAVLALVLGAFDVAFAPLMSRAWSTHDEVAMRDSYQAVHRMASMATMPIFVLVVVFRDEVLALFGDATGEATTALTILAVGHLVNATAGGSSTVLLMTGRSRVVLWNTIIYGLGLGLGAALLIPQWGIVGAAVAASTALVGLNLIRVWQVWQRHAVFPWTWQTMKPLAAGLTMGLLLWLATPYVGLAWYIPLAGMGVAAYLTLLYALQLNEDDRVVVAATLGRLRPARS